MKIAVVGTGYVGLVTGTCFAESGNDVTCIDTDRRKIETLEGGGLPIYEPGLGELVQRNRREGRLRFTTELRSGIAAAELVFIAVGTPQASDGRADLSVVFRVADDLGEHINGPKIVVIKSTVPVGTNAKVAQRIAAKCQYPVEVASNPEFLKEGAAVEDCQKPDRVVVGVRSPEVAERLKVLYAPYLRTERPFLVMSPESAEMTKYAANAMLATKISFINEIANLCERVGADINDVRRGIGHDERIGFQFLFPGAGYGGSCFLGEETVFSVKDEGLTACRLQDLFERTASHAKQSQEAVTVAAGAGEAGVSATDALAAGGPVAISLPDGGVRVLGFDLETGNSRVVTTHALTRRPYKGAVVQLRSSMGRALRVTSDHPVILWDGLESRVVRADEVQPGDRIAALTGLPALSSPARLDLVELLAGTELEKDVLVAPTDESFREQYPRFARFITREELREPIEIRDHNRMRLRLFRKLRDLGALEVPVEKLQLYTAKGAATRLNAWIPVDGDFARLCGYYLAEGFIGRDVGRAAAVRDRVGFCFHVNERSYIEDVQRILRRCGLKFIEKAEGNSHSTIVSSRVFAWLLRDVLGCGVGSEDKALPPFAFRLPEALRFELLRGAFSGDGAVTTVQEGHNLMLEYATVSKRYADGLALLLQSVGVVPSVRPRWMKKSTQPAYLVRVSGHDQIQALGGVFGDKHEARISAILAGYQRRIRPHGYDRQGSCALLKVRSVEFEEVDTTVYSLETETGTVIASSGLVCHNCFPKDIRAIIHMARELDVPAAMMQAVDQVNEAQKQVLAAKVREHYGADLAGKTLAVWGLSFKPRTDDIREAPALAFLSAMLEEGVALRVHDPEAMPNVKALFGDALRYCDRPYGALEGADGLVIVTEWAEFRNPDFEVMRRLMKHRVIFDGRNLYEPRIPTGFGFTYYSIGRRGAAPRAE